jgi:hypothetical protein
MEDQAGPVGEGAVEAPFSELISRWLDEGDRLDESAAASTKAAASRTEGPLRAFFRRLQPGIDRYRLFVLAGVGLLPLVLFLLTQRGAPASPVVASMTSVAPVGPVAPMAPSAPAPAAPARKLVMPALNVDSVQQAQRRPVKRRRPHRSSNSSTVIAHQKRR